jgi:cell division protein FtsN
MKKQVFRTILMIAGVLTVIVILLSQSFFQTVENNQAKAKTEQKSGEKPGTSHINAPSDVVPSPAVHLTDQIPTVLKSSTPEEEDKKSVFPVVRILTSFFNILLRTTISPNAP